MNKWTFMDEAKPNEVNKDYNGFYFVLALCNDEHISPWICYWEDDFFSDADREVGGEKNILAWAKINFPPAPSKQEIASHANLIGESLLKKVQVFNYD